LAKYVNFRELLKESNERLNKKDSFGIWPVDDPYEKGWIQAAKWADRLDLIADIGSSAYIKERLFHLKNNPRQD
jgi:hypothetical protein